MNQSEHISNKVLKRWRWTKFGAVAGLIAGPFATLVAYLLANGPVSLISPRINDLLQLQWTIFVIPGELVSEITGLYDGYYEEVPVGKICLYIAVNTAVFALFGGAVGWVADRRRLRVIGGDQRSSRNERQNARRIQPLGRRILLTFIGAFSVTALVTGLAAISRAEHNTLIALFLGIGMSLLLAPTIFLGRVFNMPVNIFEIGPSLVAFAAILNGILAAVTVLFFKLISIAVHTLGRKDNRYD